MTESQQTACLELTNTESGVIRTLLYFDIFHYPLTEDEIIIYHPYPIHKEDIRHSLVQLLKNKLIFRVSSGLTTHGAESYYYSVRNDHKAVIRRINGNKMAGEKLPIAQHYSKLISCFPFVRGVMLSGSLSKNYMDNESDIDYFIVTEPGRLWITRAMLALFKRVFLLNSHKFFCFNYLVDSRSLEIEEKNIYTAFETATLIPVYGKKVCDQFYSTNDVWVKRYLPNLANNRTEFITEKKNSVKIVLEVLFRGPFGEKLDQMFMQLAINRWKKAFGMALAPSEFEIAFKAKRHVSKSHPQFFQKRTLIFLKEKIKSFELHHQLKISI
jgi:hypothetical protein